jgi:rhodanese-related sulfurtransferase
VKTSVTAYELKKLLESGSITLIDVMLPEDFAAMHIPGAMNACVYEMAYLDRVTECVTDRNQAIVVYDDSGTTMTARTACEKLVRAGFLNVAFLEGGQQAWQEEGFATDPDVPVAKTPEIGVGSYIIDVEKSVVEWSGRNINNRQFSSTGHSGTSAMGRVNCSNGSVHLVNDLVSVELFVIARAPVIAAR